MRGKPRQKVESVSSAERWAEHAKDIFRQLPKWTRPVILLVAILAVVLVFLFKSGTTIQINSPNTKGTNSPIHQGTPR